LHSIHINSDELVTNNVNAQLFILFEYPEVNCWPCAHTELDSENERFVLDSSTRSCPYFSEKPRCTSSTSNICY